MCPRVALHEIYLKMTLIQRFEHVSTVQGESHAVHIRLTIRLSDVR